MMNVYRRKNMKDAIKWIVGVILTLAFIFGMAWLAKHGSYWLFYEDMVKDTVRELVKPEYLMLLK
jgi:hypothetical protein